MPDTAPRIPPLGLGTYGRTGDAGIDAIGAAIEIGYRHLDTAQSYDTEATVGAAVRRSGLARDTFFITTKVADTRLDTAAFLPSVERSIDTIGVGPVDLLLIHWPSEHDRVPLEDYVLALAEAQRRGLAKRIGVSNFTIELLGKTERLLGKGVIATNQVELHPYLQAPRLRDYARAAGLTLTAYRPLAHGAVNTDPVLKRIAAAHAVSPGAIALAFLMAEGHVVIPASANPDNLKANFAAIDVHLRESEVREIRALDRGERGIDPPKAPRWDD